jgi:hypothetical protein
MKNSKKYYQDHLYNSKQLYARIVDQLPVHPTEPIKTRNGFKLAFVMTAIVALALTLGLQLNTPNTPVAFAVISVDINPSFELTAAKDGTVLEIKAVNDDAQTIDTTDLIGLVVEEAIEQLIVRATDAGFINAEDDTDDYVIVTTVLLDETDPDAEDDQNDLEDRITDELENSDDIEDTTIVSLIKATQREKFEAEGKKVPLGLYIINGMIEVDGEMISVSDFVSNANNLEKLERKATKLINKQNRFIEKIEGFLAILAENGIDITAYEARLATEGEDLEALKDEVEALAQPYIDNDDEDIDDDIDEDDDDDEDKVKGNDHRGRGNKGKPDDKINDDDDDDDDIDEDDDEDDDDESEEESEGDETEEDSGE